MKEDEQYVKYILEHTENVMKAYNEYGARILEILGTPSLEGELFRLVCIHDKSKFSLEEFDGYRKKFFPAKDEDLEIAEDEMNLGWLNHMNTNKHHPEFWILREKQGMRPLNMDRVYIAEMILDWIAMGYKFKTNAAQWFENNEEYYKQIMTKSTYYAVSKVLTKLYPEEEE